MSEETNLVSLAGQLQNICFGNANNTPLYVILELNIAEIKFYYWIIFKLTFNYIFKKILNFFGK